MKRLFPVFLLVSVLVLSGCSLPGFGKTSLAPSTALLRSTDGGDSFESKSTLLDGKSSFVDAEVLSFAFDSRDTRRIFIGTRESGLFITENKGDSWRKIVYPPSRVYGLIVDADDSRRIFATGEWQNRGKIYRSLDDGKKWDEVYTEPANGTVITALAQNPFHPETLYAATSRGMVIRSDNRGDTWQNVSFTEPMRGHIVWKVAFDPHRAETLYFLVDGLGLFVTDQEKIVTEPTKSMNFTVSGSGIRAPGAPSSTGVAAALAFDPSAAGVIYVGSSKGLVRSRDFGKNWEDINVIESSKQSPIQAVAVNPKNSDEIVYVSSLTLYKSTDGGKKWLTRELASDKSASLIRYDSFDPSILYVGFKK